jgi:hypothetical protein
VDTIQLAWIGVRLSFFNGDGAFDYNWIITEPKIIISFRIVYEKTLSFTLLGILITKMRLKFVTHKAF